ncbi:HAD family hydrolase [Alteromonas sp. KUL49]|uniref:sulfotransferase-like domain-containing protein n=1 Tax=Alteromonas sp. KUL49 TaxID=2480798 RepID=UPI00102EFB1B|nr:HAD family hydrolase [Alteromonas sp. KUL49]TAP38621.1 HAD family hydrolase [Alteromonas sp. KUL49]GEA12561.1 branched chain amino acid aminotransferase [Alteromonas sp. KUL49]
MRIAMWSGPRNLSTAMMYAFAARTDCAVVDEPFYAAYLTATGLEHPMQEEILNAQPSEASTVIQQCLGDTPNGKSLFYQKQMTHHMVETFPLDWLSSLTNVFLIRHPARVVASYQQKRENPTLKDIGFVRQWELLHYVKNTLGKTPIVIDSDDVLEKPAAKLEALCEAIGIAYQPDMLHWPSGGNKDDGVWAPHWYGSVWKSTGLEATPKKPLPSLPSDLEAVVNQAMPYYEEMAALKL